MCGPRSMRPEGARHGEPLRHGWHHVAVGATRGLAMASPYAIGQHPGAAPGVVSSGEAANKFLLCAPIQGDRQGMAGKPPVGGEKFEVFFLSLNQEQFVEWVLVFKRRF